MIIFFFIENMRLDFDIGLYSYRTQKQILAHLDTLKDPSRLMHNCNNVHLPKTKIGDQRLSIQILLSWELHLKG